MDVFCFFFFFKQKTAYEMRISDWSSDVCSSDLRRREFLRPSADHGAAIAGAGAARLRRTADRAAQGGRLSQPLCRRAAHAAVSVRLWAELYAFQRWRAAARLDAATARGEAR